MATSRGISPGYASSGILVASGTVTGAAATTLTVTGLDLATDVEYLVSLFVVNALGSDIGVNLFYNGDTTATNYDRNVLGWTGSTATGGRANDANCTSITASAHAGKFYRLTLRPSGKALAVGTGYQDETTSLQLRTYVHAYRTAANVTSLTIQSSSASGLGVGTFVRVYKLPTAQAGGSGGVITSAMTVTGAALTTTSTIPIDNTIPQSGEGAEITQLATTINVKRAGSMLTGIVKLPVSASGLIAVIAGVFRDSAADAITADLISITGSNYSHQFVLHFKTPATTAGATVFKVRWGVSSGTGYVNRTSSTSAFFNTKMEASLQVFEIQE